MSAPYSAATANVLAGHDAARLIEHFDPGALEMGVLGEMPAEHPRPWLAVEQSENMARHLIETAPRASSTST